MSGDGSGEPKMEDGMESLCECGCGALAPIAKRMNNPRGQVKGRPLRFIPGHFGKNGTALRAERHGEWKGSAAGYDACHKRVYAVRGAPSRCEHCQSTTAKRFEWANLTKRYDDPTDYIRLCTSCHRKHDGHARGQQNGRWIGGRPEFTCQSCGLVFSRYRQGKDYVPKYCSLKCTGAGFRKDGRDERPVQLTP